ncbi:hypothetical protein TNCV_1833291 [Trichonephila clavipes]|nr:hypothetical protein TNCV_1833291 [Trichonephila clavipes]
MSLLGGGYGGPSLEEAVFNKSEANPSFSFRKATIAFSGTVDNYITWRLVIAEISSQNTATVYWEKNIADDVSWRM